MKCQILKGNLNELVLLQYSEIVEGLVRCTTCHIEIAVFSWKLDAIEIRNNLLSRVCGSFLARRHILISNFG